MKLKNIIEKIVPLIILSATNTVYASEAQKATPEQVAFVRTINDSAAAESQNHLEDWANIKKLIDKNNVTILIQPVQYQSGSCVYGLDGYPQILDSKYKDPRSENGSIELSEMILNYSVNGKEIKPNGTINPNARFFFPCNLKAETAQTAQTAQTPEMVYNIPMVAVPVPGPVIEKEVPAGKFSAGVGYLHLSLSADNAYGSDGQLHGGKASVTFQPRESNWYFGSEAMVYGNHASNTQYIKVPAVNGPLVGKLIMKGANEYSLQTLGIGLGFAGGYPFLNRSKVGMGLEWSSGLMHDWVTKELTETSAHYVNGNLLEGTNISNTSSDTESKVNFYNTLGLRLKLPNVCVIPYGGIRTNLSQINPLGGVSVGYCPK